MEPSRRGKWIVLFLISIIVAIRIGYIIMGDGIDKEYYTSSQYELSEAYAVPCNMASIAFKDDQKRLDSLEVFFSNVSDDKVGAIILIIQSGDNLIYQTNISLANINNNEWKKIYVNAEMSSDEIYTISFSVSDDCTQMPSVFVVENTWAPEIIESSVDGEQLDGQIAIRFGYMKTPSLFDKICMLTLWLWFWGVSFFILYKIESIYYCFKKLTEYVKIKYSLEKVLAIGQILLSIIIINCSGISFQVPTRVIVYIISLISIVKYDSKKQYMNELIDHIWKKVLIILLYGYAAFSLVGQRIFIYPLTLKLTIPSLFVYLVTIIWFVPVINSLFYYFEKASQIVFKNKKYKTWQFIVLCSLPLVIPAFYNLIANNPGISHVDTYSCIINQAYHLHGSGDWHPAFYCMVLRIILSIWDSTYAIIIVQYFFWLYVCLEMLLYLRKKGIKEVVLIFVSLFLGLNSGNYIYLNSILKDIPYTLSLFWTIIILAKLAIDYEFYKKNWYIYFELVIALLGTFLYRKNGIVSYIVIVAMLIIVMHKNIKIWLAIVTSVCLIFLIKGPIYSYYNIQPVKGGKYIGLSQDILGVYYSGGEVSKSTLQMINVMTNNNNAEYIYTPTWSYQSYELNIDATEFVKNYIDTFIKNPIIMTRAIIDREDAVWDIFSGADSVLGDVNNRPTQDGVGEWNDHFEKRVFTSYSLIDAEINNYIANSQWVSAVEWRCGIFVLLGLISTVMLLLKNILNKNLVIVAPIAGHILSLLLSTGWSDFRYFWPLNLMNLSIILFVIVCLKQRREFSEHKTAPVREED